MVCLMWVTAPAFASGTEFIRAPGFAFAGPVAAKGVLVWVPGTYGEDRTGPPDPPDFVGREAASGMDVWCFNRDRGSDPLDGGAKILAHEIQALRGQGYREVIVAGHSRGAWIALTALAHPGLADAVVAFSPAAHGTREGRKAQAMADWSRRESADSHLRVSFWCSSWTIHMIRIPRAGWRSRARGLAPI